MRRIVGAVRIVAGLALLATVVAQIADELAHAAFLPSRYFAYFTIQTALIDVVVLLVGGWWAVRRPRDTRLLTTVAMCTVVYAVVTTVVYNALLRGIVAPGYESPDWMNEMLHVVIPILLIVDWIVAPGRERLRGRAVWWIVAYPLAWIAFTMIRGGIDRWYPYPFLEPAGPNGVPGVVAYIVGLAAAMIALAFVAVLRTRPREPKLQQRPDAGP
ncbi:Pr6Pr family membrane protein [Pseudolysinimonas sp.]|uniref:Pr6Pr family membrane protein n=1 Tax=Pseudolysinimonas sp. TaxID=2680009 RepID=UPI003F817436